MRKLFFSMFVLLCMVVQHVSAQSSGTCGENLTWTLSNGILSINGTGETFHYVSDSTSIESAPWMSVRKSIKAAVISEGVSLLGNALFYGCSNLTMVSLPKTLKSIEYDVFSYCSSLEDITIPDSVINIGAWAFSGCYSLKNVSVSDNAIIHGGAFYHCCSLESITLPSKLTAVGDFTFTGCHALKEVVIPKGVEHIGNQAFGDMSELISVKFEGAVKTIGDIAFEATPKLKSITFNEGLESIAWGAFRNSGLQTVMLPSTLKHIGDYAFENCGFLTEIMIPEGVEELGAFAFVNCTSLEKAVLPESLKFLGGFAFDGCSALKSINIPTTITWVPGWFVSGCTSLKEISILQGVTSIGTCSFMSTGLASVTIPEGVDSIWTWAFRECVSLKEVSLPNTLKYIGQNAFSHGALETVTIPASVEKIDSFAFDICENLNHVTVEWSKPIEIYEWTFMNNGADDTLYVPSGSKEAYAAAPYWKEFKEIIEYGFIMNDVAMIAGKALQLPVELTYGADITAFQCDICLPEGITLQQNNKGKYDITLDENRADDHTVTSALQEDGSLRIVVASLSSSVFLGNSGNLFYLNLLAEEGLTGEHKIVLKNIHISEANGTRHDLNDTEATLTIQAYTPADVNNDGLIAVDDVVLTINGALGITADNFLFAAADMNADGQILVDDVVQVINSVLGISTANVMTTRSTMQESLTVADTEGGFNMNVTNAANYVAMQFDMTLPEGASLNEIQVTSNSNHAVAIREMEHGVVRVIVSSLTNDAFRGDQLLNVGVSVNETATIRLTNAYVATCGGTLVSVSDAEITRAGATGIHGIEKNATPANIYDLSGRLVKENATSTEGLQKGIYLMNGQKLVVK